MPPGIYFYFTSSIFAIKSASDQQAPAEMACARDCRGGVAVPKEWSDSGTPESPTQL